jgi:glycosyltransferase involved in cell wall biosynthesis
MEIYHLTKRMSHHSLHSGYDQLSKHMDCRIVMPNFYHRILDCCPERVLAQIRRSAGSWYNSDNLKDELQNIPDFFLKSNRIYHFLYGDDLFHYSGYLNPRRSNRLIATFHLPSEKFLRVTPTTQHLKKLAAIIIVAPNQASLFKDIAGSEKVHLVPHGIDTKFFRPLKISKPGKRCIFAGTHLRDFEMLKKVIEEINRKDPAVCFDIVTFKKNCTGFNRLKNVKFHFSITEEKLITLYNQADLLLMPVIDSTANNSLLEAMACGIPAVTTKSEGLRHYTDSKSSFMVERNESTKMADSALEIMSSPKRKESMSTAARKKALQFDWEHVAAQTLKIYHKVLAG